MSVRAYSSITITDLLDTATYIYYSATGSNSVAGDWHKGVQSGDLYIGIYSGPPLDGGQPTTPTSAILNQLVISKYVGDTGKRGGLILNITTAPSSYTTKVNNFTPTYRIALSTVLTQSGSLDVQVGDILAYSYYHYPVGYVDNSYVYLGARKNMRGATGAAAIRYSLIVSPSIIVKDQGGNYDSSSIVLTAKSKQGTSNEAVYQGYFKIEKTTDGSNWTSVYTSEANQSTYTLSTIPTDIKSLRCSLYLADGTTTLLDQQTIPIVTDGIDATQYYTYVRYSANSTGQDYTETPTSETKYIGVCVTTSSTVPAYNNSAWKWSKYIGESATQYYTYIRYSANSNGSNYTDTPSTSTKYIGVCITTATSAPAYNNSAWKWSLYVGNDAYTVLLTNESHSFLEGETESTLCGVVTYKGATQVSCYVGSSTSVTSIDTNITGLTCTITNNNSTNVQLTFGATPSLVTNSGVVSIPIHVDGKTFTKNFSFSLALKGDTGVSIISVTPLYYAKENNTAPSKPPAVVIETSTTGGQWTQGIPELTSTYPYMFTCEQVQYDSTSVGTNGYTWTNPVLNNMITKFVENYNSFVTSDTEWKNTYGQKITTIGDTVDNLQIGGRNLLADSKKDAGNTHDTYLVVNFDFTEALIENDVYTITAKIITSSEKKSVGFFHTGGSIQIGAWQPISNNNLYEVVFTATSEMASKTGGAFGHGYCRVYASNNVGTQGSTAISGTANVSWIKIEKGNVATDWSPAPEDIETRVSVAETSITQNADAIALRATKTEVTDAINDIEIGGRNLLKDTSKALSETVLASKTINSDVYVMSDFGETWRADATTSDQYSLSFDYEITDSSTSGSITPKLYGINCTAQNWDSSNKKGHYSITDTLTNSQISSIAKIEDKSPYLYRQTPSNFGKEVNLTVIGGSVGWNQLASLEITDWQTYRLNVTITGRRMTLVPSQSTTATLKWLYRDIEPNHKILVTGKLIADGANASVTFGLYQIAETGNNYDARKVFSYDGTDKNVAVILAGLSTSKFFAITMPTSATTENTTIIDNLQVFDLTLAFGSTIADYIYSLETATAGAGVAFFRKLFPNAYYPYNAGEIKSVTAESREVIGFNQWDEEWEVGAINATTGNNQASQERVRSKNYIPVKPNTNYYYKGTNNFRFFYYDAEKNFLNASGTASANREVTIPDNCWYIRFIVVASTIDDEICINISGDRNGQYEPYQKHTYPLDSLTLRGVPKLADGKIYYDGDVYSYDGTVTRRYGVVDLGTITWSGTSDYFYAFLELKLAGNFNFICSRYPTTTATSVTTMNDKEIKGNASTNAIYIKDSSYSSGADLKASLSGVYCVYELATPTTESADPYQPLQFSGSTEAFTGSEIPVGQDSEYTSYDNAVRFLLSETSGNKANVNISNIKLETGNKATDWSLAPEDLEAYADSAISTAKADLESYTDTAVSTAKAEIQITTDGISSEVSKISSAKYVTSATSSWSLTNIKTYAAEGHVENWNVTSTSGLRVGDTVYVTGTDSTRNCKIYIKTTATAINSSTNFTGTSHGYEDVLPVETIKSTINQSADSVKITANHVDIEGATIFSSGRLSQTSLNNAYDAKGAASDVQTNLDNLSIGGRNLLLASKYEWSNLTTNAAWKRYDVSDPNLKTETDYTISFDVKCTNTTDKFYVGFASGDSTQEIFVSGITATTTYQRVSFVNKTTKTNINAIIVSNAKSYNRGNENNTNGTLYIRNFKLELGNKATDWSPAPEDIDTAINAAQTTANAAAPKTDAVSEEQYIYISKASGVTSVTEYTTWVTESGDKQNTWSTKRPTYNSSYPVLFVAKQRKVVSGTVTCTTPVKDDTTTVIDGGHITTGTIDAARLNVNDIIASGSIVVQSGLNEAISNIEIGGRNLLKDTSKTLSETILSSQSRDSETYVMSDFGETWRADATVNDQYSLSFDYEITDSSTSGSITPKLYGINCTSQNWDSSNKKGHYSITNTLTNSQISSIAKIEDKSPYLYRQTSSNVGKEVDLTVVGGSVGWNQLVPITASSTTKSGVTFTNNGDGSWTISGTTTASNVFLNLDYSSGVIRYATNHVFYVKGGSSTVRLQLSNFIGSSTYTTTEAVVLKSNYDASTVTQNYSRLQISSNDTTVNETVIPQIHDLTLAFGTTIADYVYSLEQSTAGSGIAWLKSYGFFTESYYAYNSGELVSANPSERKVVGFNQWDEEWELGNINANTGTLTSATTRIRSKNYILVVGGQDYYFNVPNPATVYINSAWYDSNYQYIDGKSSRSRSRTAPANAKYMMFSPDTNYGTTYNNDICINISDTARNGTYEPCSSWSYPLDSSLELRGIPKLDSSNKLYYDGDTYASDGTVTRKYGIDSFGSLTWRRRTTNVFSASLTAYAYVKEASVISEYRTNSTKPLAFSNSYTTALDGNISIYRSGESGGGTVYLNLTTESIDTLEDLATWLEANPIILQYPLATPITETAEPYQHLQIVGSTEEFLDDREVAVPVGQDSKYTSYDNAVRFLLSETSGNEANIKIFNVKLEKGNKVTDWSQAPEDLEAYTDSVVSTAKAELKVTTDGISSEVSKISSIKYVTSAISSWTLTNIKTYAAEGRTETWNVNSTAGLRAGDTVYVKGTDSTRNCTIYMKTTVTSVNSSTQFSGVSHGYEDVLPVETIKSTINQSADSVKIQAKHIEIDGTAIFNAISSDVDDAITDKGYQTATDVSAAISSTSVLDLSDGSTYAKKSDALGAVTTKDQYYLSTSSSSATGGSWQDTVPTWSANKYIWTRVATTKTPVSGNASTTYSTAVYDSALTSALSTASSAQSSANSAASTVVTTKQYYLSTSTSSATGGSWGDSVPTWASGKYIWIRFKIVKTPVSGTATTTYSPSENGVYDSTVTTALSTAYTANAGLTDKADKSAAVSETQRIYYRSSSSTKPNDNGLPTAWVTETGDKYNSNATTSTGWTRKVTPIANGTGSSVTKYLYLWTCIQKKTVSGTVTYTDILLDDSITVIDGGNIVTGTIDANKLNATNINASGVLTVGALSNDAQSEILNSNVSVGGRNLVLNSATQRTATSASGSVYAAFTLTDYGKALLTNTTDSFTISFDYSVTGNSATDAYIYAQAKGSQISLPTTKSVNVANYPSGKFAQTFTLTATQASGTNTLMRVRLRYGTDGAVLTVSNMKLEIGNKATDWTPAPEDLPADLASATGTTVINGAHITTGTLDASKITTGMLTDQNGKNNWNLNTGAFTITDGSFNVTTDSATTNKVVLTYDNISTSIAPYGFFAQTKPTSTRSITGGLLDNQIYLSTHNTGEVEKYRFSVQGYTQSSDSIDYAVLSMYGKDGSSTPTFEVNGYDGTVSLQGDYLEDFVIDQGTSSVTGGNWYYRKWKQGRYECWFRSSSAVSVAVTTSWAGHYYGTISSINFPITFVDYPVLQVTVQAAAGGAWAAPDHSSKSASGPIYMYRPTSSTVSCYVNIYAQGRWK